MPTEPKNKNLNQNSKQIWNSLTEIDRDPKINNKSKPSKKLEIIDRDAFKLHPAGTKTSLNSLGMVEICVG